MVGAGAWVGVEFAAGTDAAVDEGAPGPGIGYTRLAQPAFGRCLLSSDGGLTFDGLDPSLSLAITVHKAAATSEVLGKSGAVVVTAPRFSTELVGARPNPFNPRTQIGFTLAAAGRVDLSIYDVRGRLVRTLLDTTRPMGEHWVVWDGADHDGAPVASGTYHAVLRVGALRQQQKLLLVR